MDDLDAGAKTGCWKAQLGFFRLTNDGFLFRTFDYQGSVGVVLPASLP